MRCKSLNPVWKDQRGITGLETAIVLIAFAALPTGVFSSDKAKETIQACLADTRGSIELKGSVVATSLTSGTTAVVSTLPFHVANAAEGEAVDLTPGKTLTGYTDSTQSKMFVPTTGFTSSGLGNADSDLLLKRKEVYEIKLLNLETGFHDTGDDTLKNSVTPNTGLTIELISPRDAVLFIERNVTTSQHRKTAKLGELHQAGGM